MSYTGRISTVLVFFVKQKTTYEMRISDWSSDVCSSDLGATEGQRAPLSFRRPIRFLRAAAPFVLLAGGAWLDRKRVVSGKGVSVRIDLGGRRIFQNKYHISCDLTPFTAYFLQSLLIPRQIHKDYAYRCSIK